MRRLTSLLLAGAIALAPVRLGAWSLDVHRFVIDRAIALLPDPIRPFFEKNRAYIVEHTIDPDLWRNAGFVEEPPRHFVDMDAYGAHPFPDLPEDYDRAVAKFGPEFVTRNGELPWRTMEMYGRLRRAFEGVSRGGYAREDVKNDAAWLAHYVSDGHVPFHAVLNYDGQVTGQDGIHARFEGELFARFRDRVSIRPGPVAPIADVRTFMFQTLRESFTLANQALKADRDAIAGRTEYDDVYFDRFFAATKPILERRLNESITAIASAITSAWEQAGRPPLPLDVPKTVEKVKVRKPAGG
jgi:hypothetical protein